MDNAGAVLILLFAIAITVLVIAGQWRVFTKAGRPGWACLVPIYNWYVIIKIAGKPGWWLLLCLVPLVNIVIGFIVMFALAERFGKGAGFALGLIFLGVIFYPILGFGDARYTPPPEPQQA